MKLKSHVLGTHDINHLADALDIAVIVYQNEIDGDPEDDKRRIVTVKKMHTLIQVLHNAKSVTVKY